MPLGKKELKQLKEIQETLNKAIEYVLRKEVLGLAEKCDYPNGGDYQLINPKCMETTIGLEEHIRVYNHHIGSKFCYFYNSKEALDRFIKIQEEKIGNKNEN